MTPVYGPFESCRHGKALGLNFLGQEKICSFNCAYCDLGATETRLNKLKEPGALPSSQDLLSSISKMFQDVHANGPKIDSLLISGNGEPTLHPDFPELIRGLIELRNQWMNQKPLVVFTNGTTLDQRRVVDALNLVDERVVKIDAGNEKMFKAVNSPLSRVNLAKVISGLKPLKNLTVQSMFCSGEVDNTATQEVEDWIEVIAMLKPKQVHIQGLNRPGASPNVTRCEEDVLHSIAVKLERRSGLRAIVTP